jgi:ABC-type nickel/cobalt efflux system permease component RcnA
VPDPADNMNPPFHLFLMQGGEVISTGSGMTPAMREWLIVMGALLGVSVVAAIWFVLTQTGKRKRRRKHHHHSHHEEDEPQAPVEKKEKHSHHRRRRHRSAHEELPRNPTLAETGGLPPIRDEDAPGSSPSPAQPR